MAPGGQTVVTPKSEVGVTEEKKGLLVVPGCDHPGCGPGSQRDGRFPAGPHHDPAGHQAAGALQADLKIM